MSRRSPKVVKPDTRIEFLQDVFRPDGKQCICKRWEGFRVIRYDRKSDTYTVGMFWDNGMKARNNVNGIERSAFKVKYRPRTVKVGDMPGPVLNDLERCFNNFLERRTE